MGQTREPRCETSRISAMYCLYSAGAPPFGNLADRKEYSRTTCRRLRRTLDFPHVRIGATERFTPQMEHPVAKPKKATPARSGPNRTYLIAGAIAVIIVVALVYSMTGTGQAATSPVAMTIDPSELQRARGVAMGPEDAPVLVHEFADYQCPACAQFSTFGHPLIKERLIDQGLIRFVRYDFPLVNAHPHAFLASRAARCAGEQERYWEYHDVLYGRQPTWSPMRDPSSEFLQYAELVGIDRRAFQQCLNSDQHAEEVTRNLRLGESLGVSGTPTLMVNGERVQLRDYRDLEARVFEAAGREAPAAGAN